MNLTEIAVRNARPGLKLRKLSDGRGLYLYVTPKGGKWWRLNYRFAGKQLTLSMGVYPDIGLKDARERRDEARRQLAHGINPSDARKEARRALIETTKETFEAIAREWLDKHAAIWSAFTTKSVLGRLERDVFPVIGTRPIRALAAPELLTMLRRIEDRGSKDTAHRVLQACGQVFRYAVASGCADRDPTGDLRGALTPVRQKHFASLTDPAAVGQLMRAINGYDGFKGTRCALRLAPLVFVRPGELRQAEWSEVDLDKAEWRIPPEKTKMRKPHIVPLASQAVEILRELKPWTGEGRYLFPCVRTAARPMSNNALNAALRRIGYTKDEMTSHGFRSMASTILNEQGWNRDVIERQLAHGEQDGVRGAYNYAEYLPERRKMIQAWADYLDNLAEGGSVVPINRTA
jgi:integrase